ncbi:MAG: hypothetical protein FJY88_14305, partial [Candidatus Eisenbacteria bacterium]|nr:hypothetical protein [Candidatus Eisenbacteria bacterium]
MSPGAHRSTVLLVCLLATLPIGAAPRALVDGGGVTQPEFAHWGFDRRWLVEGEGVLPDTAIDNDPSLTARGLDPQLDLAIQTILARMEPE